MNMAAYIQATKRPCQMGQQVSNNLGLGTYPTPNLSFDNGFDFLGGSFDRGFGQFFNDTATGPGMILEDSETPIPTDTEGNVALIKELLDE